MLQPKHTIQFIEERLQSQLQNQAAIYERAVLLSKLRRKADAEAVYASVGAVEDFHAEAVLFDDFAGEGDVAAISETRPPRVVAS